MTKEFRPLWESFEQCRGAFSSSFSDEEVRRFYDSQAGMDLAEWGSVSEPLMGPKGGCYYKRTSKNGNTYRQYT